MFKFVFAGSVAAVASTTSLTHPISDELIADIKVKATTWQPAELEENPLRNLSHGEVMGLLGTKIHEPVGYAPPMENTSVPGAFDSRDQWPQCIHQIRDQQQCGSCWAFGASEALSDRFCIASHGNVNVVLSPEDMVSCDKGDMGCNGGYLAHAWDYLENTGIVTDQCFPYTAGTGLAPACSAKCTTGGVYKKYKCAEDSIVEATTPSQIQSSIYNHGPMETGFTVYADFFNYKSGVYKHVSGGVAGGHAVKIVGWGQENGDNYWICANSWGTKWGEQGFFRIAEGQCNIDAAVYACAPDLSDKKLAT